MIAITSVNVRLKRDISVTINVSPGFMRRSRAPQFPVPLVLAAACNLRHPMIHNPIPALGEPPDLVLLIGRILLSVLTRK